MYRLKISEIIVRSLLGLLISCIVSVFCLAFSYPFFRDVLLSIGITDINLLFYIPFFIYCCVIFFIWFGFVCWKTIRINAEGISFSTLFTKKQFIWDRISKYHLEKYDAFRTGAGPRSGASLIRIFNRSYGYGLFVVFDLLMENKKKKYKFYLTCYANSENLKQNLSKYAKQVK